MTDCRFSFNAYEEKCKIAPPPIKLPARSSSKPLDNPSCFSPSHPVTASSSTCSLSSAASFSVCEDDASITTVDNDDGGTNPSDSSKTAVYEAHRMPDYPLLYTPYGQQQPPANQVLRDHCLVNLLSGYLGQGTRTLADEDTATGIDGAGQVPATTVPDTTLGINKAIAVRAKPAQQSRIVDGPSRGDARLRGGRPSCEGNLPRSMDARRAIYNDRCKEPRVPYIGPPGGDRRGQFIRGRGDRRLSYDAYGTRQRDRVEERELESNRLPRERIGGWDERIPRDRCSIDRLIHRGENSGMRGRRGDFNTIRGGDRDVDMRRGGGDRDMRRGGERDTNVWRGGGRDMDMRRGVERNMGRGGERDLDNRRGGEGNIGRGSERVVDIRRDMDMRRDMDLRRDMDMRRDMEMRRYVNRSIDGKSKAMKNPAVNMMRSDGPKTRGFDPGRRSLVPGGMIRGRTSIRGRGGIAATGTRLKGDVCGDSAANDHTVNISNHTSNVDKRLIVLDKTGIPGEVLQGDSRGVLGEEGKDAAEESCDTQNIAVESKQSDNDTSGNEELINPTGQPAGEKPLAPPTTPLCSDNISANLKQESDMLSVGDVAIDCSTAPPTRTSSLPSQQLLSNEASIDRLAALANELEGIDFELLKRNSHTWGCVQAYAKTPSDTAAAIGSVEPALDASPAHSDPVVKSAAFITPFDPNSNSPPVNNIMPYVNSRTPPSTSRMAPMHTHNPAPVNPHDPTPVHLHNTAPVTPQGPTPMHLHSTAPVTPYCLTPMHLHNTAPVTSHGPTPIHSQSPSIDHPNDPPPKQLQGPAPMHSQDPPPVHSHNRAPILPPAGQIPSVRPLPLFPSLTLSSQSNPVKSIPMASNHMTNPADPLAYKASGSSRPRKPPMDTLDAKLAALEGSLFRTTSGVDRFSVLSSMQSSISSDLNKPKPHSIGSSKTQRTSYEINGQGSSSEPESSSEDEISDEAADNIINFRD